MIISKLAISARAALVFLLAVVLVFAFIPTSHASSVAPDMRDFSIPIEVELSQSGNQPLKSSLSSWNVNQSLELNKQISFQVNSDWSGRKFGSAPSFSNCMLEIGVGGRTPSFSNPVPIFVLGSIPVSFSTGTGLVL